MILGLVALLAGMAVPSMTGLGGARQDVAASRVRTVLVYAQERAIGASTDTWVAFDKVADKVSAFVEDAANPGKANRLALTDPLTRKALVLDLSTSGVNLATALFNGTSEVQFDELGTPHDASGTPLTSDGRVNLSGGRTVRVTRNTGLITID